MPGLMKITVDNILNLVKKLLSIFLIRIRPYIVFLQKKKYWKTLLSGRTTKVQVYIIITKYVSGDKHRYA